MKAELVLGNNQKIAYDDVEEELQRGVTYEIAEESLQHGGTYDDKELNMSFVEQPNLMSKASVVKYQGGDNKGIITTSEMEVGSLLNFTLTLVKRRVKVTDTEGGEQSKCEYIIDITVFKKDGSVRNFRECVDSGKVKQVDWIICATHSLAMIPRDKCQKEAFQSMVQCCIESEDVPIEWIYPNAGWRYVDNKKWMFVYAGGAVGSQNVSARTISAKYELDFENGYLHSKKIFDDTMMMREICKSKIASTELLLFTHASLLSTIFEMAGYPLNFVFGIEGPTNSRKTSMVLTMSKIFDRRHLVADAEFATATQCGIEKCLGIYRDGVVIIDDFKPGVSTAQQRMMDAKLDQLIRLCGNRVTKKRMTDFDVDGEKKYFPITGGCVVTMELVSGVLSSITRLFLTRITDVEVDNQKLGFYQTNRWILPTHVYSFLSWVTANFEKIVQKIQLEYEKYRKSYSFAFGRYADMYANLMMTAQLLMIYAVQSNYWSNEQSSVFLGEVEKMLVAELYEMGRTAQKKDKAQIVIKAFIETFFVSQIKVMELSEENCAQRYDIYEDKNVLYIRVACARRIVNEYCYRNNEQMNVTTDDELIDIFERLGVLDIKGEGRERERSRKLPMQRGNTLRYLYLNKCILWNLQEE